MMNLLTVDLMVHLLTVDLMIHLMTVDLVTLMDLLVSHKLGKKKNWQGTLWIEYF